MTTEYSGDLSKEYEKSHVVTCPHCHEHVIIEQINCGIFRHGVLKSTGKPMHPHASKQVCNQYLKKGLIYGCGRPFQITKDSSNSLTISTCDYI